MVWVSFTAKNDNYSTQNKLTVSERLHWDLYNLSGMVKEENQYSVECFV